MRWTRRRRETGGADRSSQETPAARYQRRRAVSCGRLSRTAKSCGPDASALASNSGEAKLLGSDGVNKPITGEITKETVKTIRVRECRVIPVYLWSYPRAFFCTGPMGAAGTRHSPRPLVCGAEDCSTARVRWRRGNADACSRNFRRHRPRKRAIQYSRDASDAIERPQLTGYPACAGYDSSGVDRSASSITPPRAKISR